MKKISYILSVLSICLAFGACSEDTDRVMYYPTNTESTFTSTSGSYVFGADDPAEYNIVVRRVNPKGEAVIEIANSDTESLFNVPSELKFADGETESTLTVSFNRSSMLPGTAYPVKISLPEHPITGKATNFNLSVRRDYTWELYVTGDLKSFFVNGQRELYRDVDNHNAYKFKDLYASGYDFVFEVRNNVMTMFENQNSRRYVFVTGFVHSNPAYGMVTIDFDSDPDYSYVDLNEKKIVLSNYYYCGAGAWGWKDDVFTW